MRKRLTVLAIALVVFGSASSCSDHWESSAVEAPVGRVGDRDLAAFVGTCSEAELDVEETSEAIRLTARARVTDADSESSCGGIVIPFRLDEPLGDRPVIDTFTDTEVGVVRCRPDDPDPDPACRDLLESR